MWIKETINGYEQAYEVTKIIEEKESKFQKVSIYQTKDFGKMMSIDGCGMFCEKDAFIYHEMMVHTALCSHPDVQKVLIIGGGDGGCANEILKYPDVEVDFVEIDELVCEMSKKHFPEFSDVWNAKNINLKIEDGVEFVKKTIDNTYDIVLIDSTDPIKHAKGLFDKEFYEGISRILKPNGICVAQGESYWMEKETQKKILANMYDSFKIIMPYRFEMYSYPGILWNFIFMSQKYHPTADLILDKSDLLDDLKYYNSDIHRACFALPTYIKKEYADIIKI